MSESPELELTPTEAPRDPEPRRIWHLATNQLNLSFLLAAGMVTGPKGFGRKHYVDPLSVAQGCEQSGGDKVGGSTRIAPVSVRAKPEIQIGQRPAVILFSRRTTVEHTRCSVRGLPGHFGSAFAGDQPVGVLAQ